MYVKSPHHICLGYCLFIISGQVGDWKNWFTVRQNDMFDTYYKDRMTNSRLQIKFTV